MFLSSWFAKQPPGVVDEVGATWCDSIPTWEFPDQEGAEKTASRIVMLQPTYRVAVCGIRDVVFNPAGSPDIGEKTHWYIVKLPA